MTGRNFRGLLCAPQGWPPRTLRRWCDLSRHRSALRRWCDLHCHRSVPPGAVAAGAVLLMYVVAGLRALLVLTTTAAAFCAGVVLPRRFPQAIQRVLQIVAPGVVTENNTAADLSAATGFKATRQFSFSEGDEESANAVTLQRQLEEMQNQRDAAIKRAEQAARQNNTKGNNQELRNQVEEMQQEQLRAVRAAEGAASDAEKAAARAMRLASQLKELQAEHDNLQNSLAEARTREHYIADCHHSAQEECQKAFAKVADLTARLKNMQVECSDARSKADEARAQLQHMTKLRESSLHEAQESSGRACQLAAKLKGIEHFHDSRKKEQEGRQQERESAVRALKDAERRVEILTGQLGASKHRIASLQEERDSLQTQLDEERRKGQAKLGSKFATQLREQQDDLERVMNKKEELVASLRRQHEDMVRLKSELRFTSERLSEEKGRTRQLDEELRETRRENRVLQRERRRSQGLLSPRQSGLTDENSENAAVEAFGELLLRKVCNAPTDKQNSLKRQLLLCFHPDRNPATEVATRLTQILNGGGS